MRIAALDVGSNSFHLIVARVTPSGRLEILDRSKEMVRLGETLKDGVIGPKAFRRGLDALRALKRVAERHRSDVLVGVATSAIRDARNGREFARAARDEIGIDLRVVSGREEAHLIYLGARSSLDFGGRRAALIDVGGGSTEIIVADRRECQLALSLKLGVLRLRGEWRAADPPRARERADLRERVRRELAPALARARAVGFGFMALTSGTAFALARLAERLEGSATLPGVLTRRSLEELEVMLATLTLEERKVLPGLGARRADTVLPGAILLGAIFDLAGVERATLCGPALREGIVADYFAKERRLGGARGARRVASAREATRPPRGRPRERAPVERPAARGSKR